ncbi:hypothetical protein FVER53590_25710 [Fusarium verticillioides]|nr:hypothetical protein FVER53590_25710 [Fusarium verticillioides]
MHGYVTLWNQEKQAIGSLPLHQLSRSLFFVRLFHPCQTSKKDTSEPLSALCALGHLRLVPLANNLRFLASAQALPPSIYPRDHS